MKRTNKVVAIIEKCVVCNGRGLRTIESIDGPRKAGKQIITRHEIKCRHCEGTGTNGVSAVDTTNYLTAHDIKILPTKNTTHCHPTNPWRDINKGEVFVSCNIPWLRTQCGWLNLLNLRELPESTNINQPYSILAKLHVAS